MLRQRVVHFLQTYRELGEVIHEELSYISDRGPGRDGTKNTFWKELTLKNMLYAPEIRKNLVFESLLNKHDFRMLFE